MKRPSRLLCSSTLCILAGTHHDEQTEQDSSPTFPYGCRSPGSKTTEFNTSIALVHGLQQTWMAEMSRIRESTSNYHEALSIQRDRLQISDWLIGHRAGDDHCPICGGNMETGEENLRGVQTALREPEETAMANR